MAIIRQFQIIFSSITIAFSLIIQGIFSETSGQVMQNSITDIDNNIYKMTVIGEQIWLTENLKTTKYNDGTPIPNITDITEWRNSNEPGFVWYDNDISNKYLYGALYNGFAVLTKRELCPAGWRVATDGDWKELENYLGMTNEEANGLVWRGTIEGGKLKQAGTKLWTKPNEGATNESNFNIIPSGRCDSSGKFYDKATGATIWTSTETSMTCAFYRHFASMDARIGRNPDGDKKFGLAVRCIKIK